MKPQSVEQKAKETAAQYFSDMGHYYALLSEGVAALDRRLPNPMNATYRNVLLTISAHYQHCAHTLPPIPIETTGQVIELYNEAISRFAKQQHLAPIVSLSMQSFQYNHPEWTEIKQLRSEMNQAQEVVANRQFEFIGLVDGQKLSREDRLANARLAQEVRGQLKKMSNFTRESAEYTLRMRAAMSGKNLSPEELAIHKEHFLEAEIENNGRLERLQITQLEKAQTVTQSEHAIETIKQSMENTVNAFEKMHELFENKIIEEPQSKDVYALAPDYLNRLAATQRGVQRVLDSFNTGRVL